MYEKLSHLNNDHFGECTFVVAPGSFFYYSLQQFLVNHPFLFANGALQFFYVRGFPSYTRDLRQPHRKKSHIERSGDQGGQATSPHREMRRSGNMARTTAIAALAV